jgi:beta-glucosidase
VADCWPECGRRLPPDPALEARIDEILSAMTLPEKVGQMIQAEIRSVTPDDVRRYRLGSVLNGGGAFPHNDKHAPAETWIALADAFHDASMHPDDGAPAIPLVWGVDAVHGHNNVFGATLFPHNIGLGAANDPDLVEAIARATAREILATGIDWNFAPTVAVVRDDLWGRTYEGYSEDPEIVRSYAARLVRGLQGTLEDEDWMRGERVISTAKHFIGDGGTADGVDQGDNTDLEHVLCDVHGQGYFAAIEEGVLSIMASFNSWHGLKVHGHAYLLTDVLKGRLGFDGVVVSDWNGHQQVDGYHTNSCRRTLLAGVDMIMVPEGWKPLIRSTIVDVERGHIPVERIDDAVRRILRMKLRAGLFERGRPSGRATTDVSRIGCAEHRALAREAARKSLVLLKNRDGLLPLDRTARVLVAGDGAHDIGKQCGGWTLTWQGTDNERSDFPGATSIFEGIEELVSQAGGKVELAVDGRYETRPDVAIVVFGEDPYAEGVGDRAHLSHSAERPGDLELLRRLKGAGIPVVAVLLSGRPLWVNPELNASDAFVAAWLPGSEGGALADLLFAENGDFDFTGRLSYSWPSHSVQSTANRGDFHESPLFPYGYGLGFGDADALGDDLPEDDEAAAIVEHEDVRLFDRAVVAPYELFVGDPLGWRVRVTGSPFESASGALAVRTVDARVQEDGRRADWDGRAPGQLYLQSAVSHDFHELAEADARLLVQLTLHEAPTDAVVLRMDAVYPDSGAVDVTERLRALPLDELVELELPLRAWAEAGARLAHIDTPFLLWTAGRLSLTFTDVRIARPPAARAVPSAT